jgi:multidrug efflux pump subunit AcrA (membrane-fusion protein)
MRQIGNKTTGESACPTFDALQLKVGQAVWPVILSSRRLQYKIMSVACVLALLGACGRGTPKEKAGEGAEAPTPVLVETAVLGAMDHVVVADAVLFPINQANITSKISAPVKKILVNRGDHVKAGQIVLELESADLTAAENESRSLYEQSQAAYQTVSGATIPEDRTKSQADVKSFQEAYDAAKKLYDNRVNLQKEGALAMKLVDDAKVALVQAQSALETARQHQQASGQVSHPESLRSAQAQVNAAKAHYEAASVQLGYAKVRSPINGVVSDRSVYPGEMAASGTALVSVVDISKVVARANVPMKEAAAIQVGRPARLNGPDGDISGKVIVVSPAVDPSTTTIEVWVEADNPGELLKPGASVRVSIVAETLRDTMVVPAAALLNSDDGGQKVMVVTSDSVAHERRVNVGIRQGDRVQIISGLQSGDQVVVSGGLGLEDKAKVAIQQPKAEDDDDDNAPPDESKDDKKDAKGAKK